MYESEHTHPNDVPWHELPEIHRVAFGHLADAALAAIEASGWVLAPQEPTLEQLAAVIPYPWHLRASYPPEHPWHRQMWAAVASERLAFRQRYRDALAARPRSSPPSDPEKQSDGG
jgi:hypothetical protein